MSKTTRNSESRNEPKERELRDDELALVSGGAGSSGLPELVVPTEAAEFLKITMTHVTVSNVSLGGHGSATS